MILAATTDKLEILLGGAVTTNELPFVVTFIDISTATGKALDDANRGQGITTGATPADLVAAPGANIRRQVKFIQIEQADTVAQNVTVRYNANATTRATTYTLAPSDKLIYVDGAGWTVLDSAGGLKQGSSAGVSSISGTANEITASAATGAVTLSLPTALTFTGKTVTGGTFSSPTLTTPALGTPASGVLTNATGLPISTGVSGLGSGVATFLATPSSANFLAAVTDETGTGALVFGTSPVFTTQISTPSIITASGALGITPAAGSGLNITLSTTGDFAINTNQFFIDTSANLIGFGTVSPGSSHMRLEKDWGEPDDVARSLSFIVTASETTASTINSLTGVAAEVRIGGTSDAVTNTQNWTTNPGLVCFSTLARLRPGMSGAVTGYAGFQAQDPIVSAGTLTNQYGLRVEPLTAATNNYGVYIDTPSGGTINRAIHVVGGESYFGGNLGVGATPASPLHVDQNSATGAVPVLTLDQGDDSEEMIEFIGTIGVGNAIEAVGVKTLTTTHFIKVTIPGGLTRYFSVGTIA